MFKATWSHRWVVIELLICFLFFTLKASSISSTGDHYEITELAEVEESCGDDNICKKYLHDAALVLASDCTKGTLSMFSHHAAIDL